jgi:lipid-binding SYLF domain-containing protein
MGNHAVFRTLLTVVFAVLAAGSGLQARAQEREEARLLTASQVLQEALSSPDEFIPQRLLQRAYGIAVIPDVTKFAFFFGGRRGNGVLVARDANGHFTDPVFVNLTGGSFGFQWGLQSTDVVLVFTTQRSIDRIAGGQIHLGADASVAAGPVGRQAYAGTTPTLSAEVYSYSRARGLFAGIALDGSALTIDDRANSRFYDRGTVVVQDVISGQLRTDNDIARRFLATVNRATGSPTSQAASPAPPAPAPAPASAPASGAAQTFPLSDPRPGAEPPG